MKRIFLAVALAHSLLAFGSLRAETDVHFTDDFESGLVHWTIGGRRLAGPNVADTVFRHGSMMGHLYKFSFTEITFSREFPFDPRLRFVFDMEATASSQPPPSPAYYGAASVRIQFLDEDGAFLGLVGYTAATTSYLVDFYRDHPTIRYLSIPRGGLRHHDYRVEALLSEIDVDPAEIASVVLEFNTYSSTYPYPSVSAELWVDDVIVTTRDLSTEEPSCWDPADGGNGHRYLALLCDASTIDPATGTCSWEAAREAARALGEGWDLATLTSSEESAFVKALFCNDPRFFNTVQSNPAIQRGPWIGGYWIGPGVANYAWVTGEPFGPHTNWGPLEPFGNGDRISFADFSSPFADCSGIAWNDIGSGRPDGPIAFVAEGPGPCASDPPVARCRNVVVAADDACLADASVDDGSHDSDGGDVSLAPSPPGPYGLGVTTVILEVEDHEGLTATCEGTVEVVDETAPRGGIVSPAEGVCTAGPVTIEDDYVDNCDGSLSRAYAPPPGPVYAGHGDHAVTLTVTDDSGNAATDGVSFTIDRVPPSVEILAPADRAFLVEGVLPLAVLYSANDDDGAAGGIVHERIRFDGCTILDGATYGDGDGLLTDESLALTVANLCAAAERCGFTTLVEPELRVEATDCAGNVGSDAHRFTGSLRLKPGICE